jgi:hypothetical protein
MTRRCSKFWLKGLCFVLLLAIPFLRLAWTSYEERQHRLDRIADLGLVCKAHALLSIDSDAVTFQDVIAFLHENNQRLKNPLALDPARPCYEFVSSEGCSTDLLDKVVVRENNNVGSRQLLGCRIDGSVVELPK